MPTRRCCCNGVDCLITSDDFNRADSNPPSGSWHVVSGEWEIDTNQLKMITEGPILTTVRQPRLTRPNNTDFTIKMFFRWTGIGTGETCKVICGYLSATNYYYIEFYELSGSVYPKFYHYTGSASLLMDITTHPAGTGWPVEVGDFIDLKICWSEVDWTADQSTDSESSLGNELSSESTWTYTGVGGQANLPTSYGMVGFLKGDFDDFELFYHWESNVQCDYCSCLCRNPDDINDYFQFPETMLVTFVPMFDPSVYGCELNNAEIEIHQRGPLSGGGEGKSPEKKYWENTGDTADTPSGIGVQFYCENSSGPVIDRFRLGLCLPTLSGGYDWGDGGSADGCPTARVDWTESSCNPLHLVFKLLEANATTCEISPGVQGIKNPLCITGECIAENPSNVAFLEGLQWKLVVTEV